jgi:hypothetical protein
LLKSAFVSQLEAALHHDYSSDEVRFKAVVLSCLYLNIEEQEPFSAFEVCPYLNAVTRLALVACTGTGKLMVLDLICDHDGSWACRSANVLLVLGLEDTI